MSADLLQTQEIHPSVREALLRQCSEMATYALVTGKPVDAKVLQAIESCSVSGTAGSSGDLTVLAAAHAALCDVIKPATPQGVHYAARQAGKTGFWARLGQIRIVRAMSLCALLSLTTVIALSLSPKVGPSFDYRSSSGITLLLNELFVLAAAALGASFIALLTVKQYVVNRSYDPQYEMSYWVEFFLGVTAGFILAVLVAQHAAVETNAPPFHGFATDRALLALLGGFSSKVVARVLQRLTEAVETLIQGRAGLIETKEQSVRAAAADELAQARIKLATSLMALQSQLQQEINGSEAAALIGEMVKNVMSRSGAIELPLELAGDHEKPDPEQRAVPENADTTVASQ